MGLSKHFETKWLKAELLPRGKDVVATIKWAGEMDAFDSKEQKEVPKPCLVFEETQKPLILNVTNWRTLCHLMGKEPDEKDLVGVKITLYTTEVEAFGEQTLAIRIRKQLPSQKLPASEGGMTPPPTEEPPPPTENAFDGADDDSSVPF